jgi:DNA-binding MarR family transcriptional regulator
MTQADYRALSQFRFHIRRFLHFSEEAARAEGLEPQQHQMLLAIQALDGGEGPTIGELADHLVIRHHSAVGLVDRLTARGLAERFRGNGDRRQVRVRLTDEGALKLHRLSALHQEELGNTGPHLVEALQLVIPTR